MPALLAVAFATLLERKLMASVQLRVGPTRTGLWGVLQPIADALKLLGSELLVPSSSALLGFMLAPAVLLVSSILLWLLVPLHPYSAPYESDYAILLVLAISSLAAHAIIASG